MERFKNRPEHKKNYLLLLLLLTLPFGIYQCSLMKVGMHFSEYLIIRQIDEFFDLNDKQEETIRKKLPSHLAWAKKELGPFMIGHLNVLKSAFEKGLEKKHIQDFENGYKILRQSLFAKLADDASELLLSLDDKQMTFLERKLQEANEHWKERLQLPDQEYIENRKEKAIERFEEFFGSITDEQQKALYQFHSFSKTDGRDYLHQRVSSQRGFMAAIRNIKKNTPAENQAENQQELMKKTILSWAGDPALLRDNKKAQDTYRSYQERDKRFFATFYPLLNAQQKKHAADQFDEWMGFVKTFMKT